MAKKTKEEVDYTVISRCGNCIHFQPLSEVRVGDGNCQKVDGQVSILGHCKLYQQLKTK